MPYNGLCAKYLRYDVSDPDDVICDVHVPGQHTYGEDS